jgi:DNA-binding GntR family transcriptional regulator
MILTKATVRSTTYERIKHDIIYGVLEPGLKLKLEALRDRYNASVSTLRETLNRLASEGFVVAAEQRGFFVKPVSKKDLTEIAYLRILLESSALETGRVTLSPLIINSTLSNKGCWQAIRVRSSFGNAMTGNFTRQ